MADFAPFNLQNAYLTAERVQGARQNRQMRGQQLGLQQRRLGLAEQQMAGQAAAQAAADEQGRAMISLSEAALGGDEGALAQIAARNPQRASQLQGVMEAQQPDQPDPKAIVDRARGYYQIGESALQIEDDAQRAQYLRSTVARMPDGPIKQETIQAIERGETSPDNIRRFMGSLEGLLAQGGLGGSLSQALGPDGEPAFIRTTPTGVQQVEGFSPMPRSGETIEGLPGGGFRITRGGSGGGDSQLSSSTVSGIQGEMLSMQDTMSSLDRLEQLFDPQMLEYGTQLGVWASGQAERLGMEISPEQRNLAQRYSALRSTTNQTLSTIIKQLSGAAVNASEEARLRGFIPTLDDSPTEYREKLREFQRQTRHAYMRRAYMLQNGMDVTPEAIRKTDIGLDAIPSLFDRRVEEVLSNLQRDLPDYPRSQLVPEARSIARREFGL